METRAAKRRANSIAKEVEDEINKRQRVVLGELSIVSTELNQRKEKIQCRRNSNPNVKKLALTKRVLSSPNVSLDNPEINQANYLSDIYEYLRTMEMQEKRRPMIDYMEKVQREITTNMRGILVDWLVEVGEEYKLLSETLYLSVSYIDRFLSINSVKKSRFQLLGVSSMLIAAKYEEIDPPSVEKFCSITDNTYNKKEVVGMEAEILKALKFEMGNPTVNTFLRRFSNVDVENQKTQKLRFEFLVSYLAELSLLDYDCLRFLPSVIAASAIFLARFILWQDVHPWNPTLYECSGYKSAELKDCVLILHDLYLSRKAASFKAVREKYKQLKFKSVANLPSSPYIPSICFEDL